MTPVFLNLKNQRIHKADDNPGTNNESPTSNELKQIHINEMPRRKAAGY
jgi:hypothetical protein